MTHRGTARPAALLVVAVALLAPSIAPTGSRSSDPASGKLRRLLLAYPDFLDHESGANAVVFNDGTRMTFDDGRPKNGPEALMNDADLEDQMRMDYPPGRSWREPAIDHDPGRARYEPFFKKMYGATEREVRSHLVAVEWLPRHGGQKLYVTRVNGVNRALEEVSRELDDRPDLIRFVDHPAGAFNWRPVNGTTRLSTHSYGIALDVNLRSSDYWEWKPRRRGLVTYVNRIPGELVEIFERHGFIWAGKWYHYDTMHFEYRPELLPLSGCAPGSDAGKRPASTRR